MQCQVVKTGHDCTFATATGCGFGSANETCSTVVEQCSGCDHIQEFSAGKYCDIYAAPASKWAVGICNFATHAKVERAESKKKINPLKASKKAARG